MSQTNKATSKYVKELTTDLYYDILAKYVALKADHNRLKVTNKKLQVENNVLRERTTDSPEDIIRSHNGNLDIMKGIVYKHKDNYKETLKEIDALKMGQEVLT